MATTVRKTKPKFTTVSGMETKVDYRGHKFILKEGAAGVYGMGKCMYLYELNGLNRKLLQTIGWTQVDGGYGTHGKGESFLGKGIFTVEQCKVGAIKFIDSMLD
jgi:hypothetical protein